MLRLWNNAVYARVFLGEKHISVCLIRGKFQPQVINKAQFNFSVDALANGLATLKEWLTKNFLGQRIEWVLGIHYVRYLMLPWSNQHLKDSFSAHLARQLLSKKFQQDVNDYEIKISKLEYAQPLLATFCDKNIILVIQQFIKDSSYKNALIEPLLSIVWNRFYPQIKRNSNRLAIVDEGRTLIIQHDQGQITSLSLRPFTNEKTIINSQKQQTFFFYPRRGNDEIDCKYLDIRDRENRILFSYALCGVF